MSPKKRIKKLNVAVLFGGRSGEHEVSIVSARSIVHSLDPKRYSVTPLYITQRGRWLSVPASRRVLDDTHKNLRKVEAETTPHHQLLQLLSGNAPSVNSGGRIDVMFPVLHGPFGEDGTVQGLLELADIPYVGSGVLGSAVAMDKVVQKELCRLYRIPIAPYVACTHEQWKSQRTKILQEIEALRYPLFSKPANLGSSIGIRKVRNRAGLRRAITESFSYDTKVLIEQAIPDAREIDSAVLGNDPYTVAPALCEIVTKNEFYDFAAKYLDEDTEYHVPAKLPSAVRARIHKLSAKVCALLNVQGMARVEFLITRKTHRVVLNEVNTIPGFTSHSIFPRIWKHSGLSFPKLLDRLIALALKRARATARRGKAFSSGSSWYNESG